MRSSNRDEDILLLPGLGGSGVDHWQAKWARVTHECRIVAQADWDRPEKNAWLAALSAEVQDSDGPFILVAHSVGCALAAHWIVKQQDAKGEEALQRLKAVMMVAPADVDSVLQTPDIVRSFAPMPTQALPCKSVVVASADDPYVSIQRARYFAAMWDSLFVEIGARGHINADSGLGDWPEGKRRLASLIGLVRASEAAKAG